MSGSFALMRRASPLLFIYFSTLFLIYFLIGFYLSIFKYLMIDLFQVDTYLFIDLSIEKLFLFMYRTSSTLDIFIVQRLGAT